MSNVEVDRSDLIFLQRVLDTAFAELEALAADGDIKESIIIDMEDAMGVVKGYLR